MSTRTDQLDLASLRLAPGEGRRMDFAVQLNSLTLADERYEPDPALVDAKFEVSRMVGHGYALRLLFATTLTGPCMRCLKPAAPLVEVDVREVDRPSGRDEDDSEELSSPYMAGELLDLAGWAHDSLVLAAPVKVLCREDCQGLCPICAVDLNEAGPEHHHEPTIDPRWAKLRELKLD
jgi:uncharacterized protein